MALVTHTLKEETKRTQFAKLTTTKEVTQMANALLYLAAHKFQVKEALAEALDWLELSEKVEKKL